ncbi:hypothetical protein NX059_005370 [Plenodomus lindquistii]|nr:hypothetical protein NX059_005370 [Plenodomus lindquistii]
MDPQTDLPTLVEDLEVNIDELTETLAPLLSTPLSKSASSLPLLDKSKLYVLAAYSIESLLFSTLQASGINAKEHAIFPELARLKGYFGKIKEIEDRGVKGSAEGRARLDVGAAQRFIKHGLSGNERYDLERKEKIAKEKARAAIKARQINKKFEDEDSKVQEVTPKKRGADEVVSAEEESSAAEQILGGLEEPTTNKPASKKPRVSAADLMDVDSEAQSASSHSSTSTSQQSKPRKQRSKKATQQQVVEDPTPESTQPTPNSKKTRGRSKKSALHDAPPPAASQDQQEDSTNTPPTATRKSRRHNPRAYDEDKSEEAILPPQDDAPKTRSEAFNALLSGDLPKGKAGKVKGKGKGKAKAK